MLQNNYSWMAQKVSSRLNILVEQNFLINFIQISPVKI